MNITNTCIICGKNANQTGSHIVPMNLIKECIGERDKEISFDVDVKNNKIVSKKIYIGNELKHESEGINDLKLKEINVNPYTLDYILCSCCEKKLGRIEGKVYSEIILKVRDKKYQNNFLNVKVNNFEVLIPKTKRITKVELEIYFYSIILRVIKSLKPHDIPINLVKKNFDSIANFLNNKIYGLSEYNEQLKTGLIIYITNSPKLFPTFLESNKFEKLIIPVCNFIIILEYDNLLTPFGTAINLVSDEEFKFLKNSEILDENLFSVQNFLK